MDPSQAFTGLFTLPFIILVLIIGLTVSVFRWCVEIFAQNIAKYFPDKYEPWWKWFWREAVLPAAPIITGGLIGWFIDQYPYPDPFNVSDWARLFIGVIAGLVASFCYPRIVYYLRKFGNGKIEEKIENKVENKDE